MKELVIKIADEVYKTVQDGTYCGSLYEELKAAKPYEPAEDLISRSDALKAVDNRHEELLHDTVYRKKPCQIDLLGIKKHILAIPPANVLKPTKGDLISREALKKAIKDNGYSHYFEIFEIIDNAQAIPQGEWARHDEWRGGEYIGGFYHVNCPCKDGYYSKWETNFCPNCGLPMKKGGKKNEH